MMMMMIVEMMMMMMMIIEEVMIMLMKMMILINITNIIICIDLPAEEGQPTHDPANRTLTMPIVTEKQTHSTLKISGGDDTYIVVHTCNDVKANIKNITYIIDRKIEE